MANFTHSQEIPADSFWPTDDPLTYVESLLQNDVNTKLGMLQSDPMDSILSFDDPDWLTAALAETNTPEPMRTSPALNRIVEIEEIEAEYSVVSPNNGEGRKEPSYNVGSNLLETDTTPLAVASQPLIIPRQPAVMQPISSQPGRKRKNPTPSGIMVFSLPGRQSKRRKMTEQERQSRAQVRKARSCLRCCLQKIQCSYASIDPSAMCKQCEKKSSDLSDICVRNEIDDVSGYIADSNGIWSCMPLGTDTVSLFLKTQFSGTLCSLTNEKSDDHGIVLLDFARNSLALLNGHGLDIKVSSKWSISDFRQSTRDLNTSVNNQLRSFRKMVLHPSEMIQFAKDMEEFAIGIFLTISASLCREDLFQNDETVNQDLNFSAVMVRIFSGKLCWWKLAGASQPIYCYIEASDSG